MTFDITQADKAATRRLMSTLPDIIKDFFEEAGLDGLYLAFAAHRRYCVAQIEERMELLQRELNEANGYLQHTRQQLAELIEHT
jgi:hypothetical protein